MISSGLGFTTSDTVIFCKASKLHVMIFQSDYHDKK